MKVEIKKDNMKEVGELLKSRREGKGITIYQIERECGENLFRNSIVGIESGRACTVNKLRAYCDLIDLKITISDR